MKENSSRPLMTQMQYAQHRGTSLQYIHKLAKSVLAIRNGKVDVVASNAVLDGCPVAVEPTESVQSVQSHSATGTTGQQPTSFAQTRLADGDYYSRVLLIPGATLGTS